MSVATFAAAQILRFLPRRRLSRAVGRLCEQPLPPAVSRTVERMYVQAFGVDMSDVLPRSAAYPSFDAFFTRPLRTGARDVDVATLVSPADGRVVDAGPVDQSLSLSVKGKPYSVADLVGSAAEGRRYQGGSFVVVYLSPRDYHRVHAPCSGRVDTVRSIPGDLFPVNAIGEAHVPGLFARNQRVAAFMDSEELGRVAVVLVGALIVGKITISFLGDGRVSPGDHAIDPPLRLQAGDELGKFHLGSTVVLLTARRLVLARGGGPVRYGEALAASASPEERS